MEIVVERERTDGRSLAETIKNLKDGEFLNLTRSDFTATKENPLDLSLVSRNFIQIGRFGNDL